MVDRGHKRSDDATQTKEGNQRERDKKSYRNKRAHEKGGGDGWMVGDIDTLYNKKRKNVELESVRRYQRVSIKVNDDDVWRGGVGGPGMVE